MVHRIKIKICYGETVIIAWLLTTLPTEAVIVTVPGVVLPATIVTTPADTVARLVLLDCHVATSVTSFEPLQVAASALIANVGLFVVIVPLVLSSEID